MWGPAGFETQDQGIHVNPGFPPGVDYLFTLGREAGGCGCSSLSSKGNCSPQ